MGVETMQCSSHSAAQSQEPKASAWNSESGACRLRRYKIDTPRQTYATSAEGSVEPDIKAVSNYYTTLVNIILIPCTCTCTSVGGKLVQQ